MPFGLFCISSAYVEVHPEVWFQTSRCSSILEHLLKLDIGLDIQVNIYGKFEAGK